MRKSIKITALGHELDKLRSGYPRATARAMHEAAEMLKGALIPIETALAHPEPVDRGAYKGGWRASHNENGSKVTNLAKYAGVLERGRRPGKAPPLNPIVGWVLRKGLWKDEYAARRKADRGKGASRRVKGGKVVKAHVKRKGEAMIKAEVVTGIARAIQRKIARQGTMGHGILYKAIMRLEPKMPGIIKRALQEEIER